MKWKIAIGTRIAFVLGWFAVGYFPSRSTMEGVISAALALLLMEAGYQLDKRTVGIDKIVGRLSYLDETLEEAGKTKQQILDQLIIKEQDVEAKLADGSEDEEYVHGFEDGIEAAEDVVKARFQRVADELAGKRKDA